MNMKNIPNCMDVVNVMFSWMMEALNKLSFMKMDPSYEISTPSESYYRRVEQGFRDNDLDTRFLEEAYAKCKR